MPSRWSPALERARRSALVDRAREGSLFSPVWVLAPRGALRTALADAVARRGGGFVRFVDWSVLANQLDDLLGLGFAAPIAETERALVLERALFARVSQDASLASALKSDPFGVALQLLRVVDQLRLHRWDGRFTPAPEASPAARLVEQHLSLLGALIEALEGHLRKVQALDTLGRIARAERALREGRGVAPRTLLVDGIDRLAPLERDLLYGLIEAGWRVDLAGWVEGTVLDRAAEAAPPDAPTLLEALDRGAQRSAGGLEGLELVLASDPYDEAEGVARWVAEGVARGEAPSRITVAVTSGEGNVDRILTALTRYDLPAVGNGQLDVRQSPLWQVMRAAVSLAWNGVDVVDLATLFAAPGAGLWGGERDAFVARLRRTLPTTWQGVRTVLFEVTETQAPGVVEGAGDDPGGAAAETAEPRFDPRRTALREEMRRRAGSLLDGLEQNGPFSAFAPPDRVEALARVVELVVERFCTPKRFSEALHEPRIQTAWLGAAQAVAAGVQTALERLRQSKHVTLPEHDAGAFLGPVEALLGAVEDVESPPREGGVRVRGDDPYAVERPETLVVMGFVDGRFPRPVGRPLLLGPLERARLATLSDDLARLPSEADEGRLSHRDALRLLALPTKRLVLTLPRVGALGAARAPSALVAEMLHLADAPSAEPLSVAVSMAAWSHGRGASRTSRARLLDAVAALGSGDFDASARALGAVPPGVAARDMLRARWRPDQHFVVGDLVRGALREKVFTRGALESLLLCKYRFLTGELLQLRPLGVARRPHIRGRDQGRVARAAMRRLDAARALDPGAPVSVAAVVAEAVEAVLPWVAASEQRLEREALERGVRGFLSRYLELRDAWQLDQVSDPEAPEARTLSLALPGGRTVTVDPESPRVETLTVSAAAQPEHPLVFELTRGSMEAHATLREAGLDVDAALAPVRAAAAREASAPAGFVRLSLVKPEGEAVLEDPREGRVGQAIAAGVSRTLVKVETGTTLGRTQARTQERIAEALDALDRDAATYGPHSRDERAQLEAQRARSCEHCAMALGCRFKLAGGAA